MSLLCPRQFEYAVTASASAPRDELEVIRIHADDVLDREGPDTAQPAHREALPRAHRATGEDNPRSLQAVDVAPQDVRDDRVLPALPLQGVVHVVREIQALPRLGEGSLERTMQRLVEPTSNTL